jgi:uncharacterized membrane protein YfcA
VGVVPTVAWEDGVVVMIDQRRLPAEQVLLRCRTHPEVVAAIRDMAIRGAPAIGVAAAFGLALGVLTTQTLLLGLLVGSSLMLGSWLAKRVVQRMDAGQFKILLEAMMLAAGAWMIWAAVRGG